MQPDRQLQSPAPEYGRQIDPRVERMALESLNEVKRANVVMMDLSVDPGLVPSNRPTYNIWSDQG